MNRRHEDSRNILHLALQRKDDAAQARPEPAQPDDA